MPNKTSTPRSRKIKKAWAGPKKTRVYGFLDSLQKLRFVREKPDGNCTLLLCMTRTKWTQTRLSKATGISQGDISKMISGKRAIGPKSAKVLGKALGVDYRKFL